MTEVQYAVADRVARITLNRFRAAVRVRDEPSGDLGPSTFKG